MDDNRKYGTLKSIAFTLSFLLIGILAGVIMEIHTALTCECYEGFPLILGFFTTVGCVLGLFIDLIRKILRRRKEKGCQNQRFFDELPVDVQSYINQFVKAIRYRKKIRIDVQAELIAHFEDALNDCKTDEEKEIATKELITNFGDAKMLGKLARRAKKRCRPLWKKIIIKTFQVIGILFLLLALYIGWFFMGKPVIDTNYIEVMNERTKPYANVDPNLNAERVYKQAYKLVEEIEKTDDKYFTLFRNAPDEVNEVELGIIKTKLADIGNILNLIEQGSQKPYYWIHYTTGENTPSTEAIAVIMPGLSDFRKISKALCWRARIRFDSGNYRDAADDLMTTYRLGRGLKGDKTLIEQLVGIAIEAISIRAIIELSADAPIDFVAEVKQRFEREFDEENFRTSFEQERIFMLDEIQRSFTESRIFGSHIYLKRVRGLGAIIGSDEVEKEVLSQIISIMFTHPDKQATLDGINGFYDRFEEYSKSTPFANKQRGIDIDEALIRDYGNNLFLKLLAPALGKVSMLSWRNRIDVEATYTILSLLVYKSDKGGYPESLLELKEAGYIDSVPIDPFSDEPLVYRMMDEGFILYSFGQDFDDDDGVLGKDTKGNLKIWSNGDGDAVFWPLL